MMWGSNVPVTRTPDAHWMAEARYRGQKVVVVSPDYADNTKFADEWLHPHLGTDGALAMALGHVVLKEFFVDRTTEFFDSYVRSYTDLPFLVTLTERDGALVPAKFLRASDLGDTGEGAEWKTVVLDEATGRAAVPGGSLGFRWTESGKGKWNLALGSVVPQLSLHGDAVAAGVEVLLPASTPRAGRTARDAARCCGGACPRRGSAARTDHWSPPSSTCCSPSTAWGGPVCRAAGPPGTRTPRSRAPRRGRRRTPRCRRRRR